MFTIDICIYFPDTKEKDMHLESWGFKYAQQKVEGNVISMKLNKQESKAACVLGESFGFKENIVWVDKGARGWFKVIYTPSKSQPNPTAPTGTCSTQIFLFKRFLQFLQFQSIRKKTAISREDAKRFV